MLTPAQLRAAARKLEEKADKIEEERDRPREEARKRRIAKIDAIRKNFGNNLNSVYDLPEALRKYAKRVFNLDVKDIKINEPWFRIYSNNQSVFSMNLTFKNPFPNDKWPKGSHPLISYGSWSPSAFDIFNGRDMGPYCINSSSGSGGLTHYRTSIDLLINMCPKIKAQMDAVNQEKFLMKKYEEECIRQNEIASKYVSSQKDVIDIKAQIAELANKLNEVSMKHYNSVYKKPIEPSCPNKKFWSLFSK